MANLMFISNIAAKRYSYNFSGASVEASRALGYQFYNVANRSASTSEEIAEDETKYGIKLQHIDLARNPLSHKNLNAYKQLVRLMKEDQIDYIHCNTPVGGILGRLAGKKCKAKKVIYQVHGFHFYKGAPLMNKLIYYPVERWLAHYTDAIITINQEDYETAKKLHLREDGKVYYVHGVGIETDRFSEPIKNKDKKREELGFSKDDFIFISAGRLDVNKNNETLIRAVERTGNHCVKLVLCGEGGQREYLMHLAKELGVENQVVFLGNRNDMVEIYKAADALLMASFREGLSRTIMEAMASGLPCIVSKIRGNVDLIEDSVNGFLSAPKDVEGFTVAINKLAGNAELCARMKTANIKKIRQYDFSVVKKEMEEIYKKELV